MPIRAQRGSRGIATLMPNLGAMWGWVVNTAFRERAQVDLPVVEEVGSIRTGMVKRSHARSELSACSVHGVA